MTAIAAICRGSEIVIAADSRRLGVTANLSMTICKIRDLRTLFVAVSGINSYDPTHFDVSELVPAEMPDVDLATNAASIRDLLLSPLSLALEHLRANHSETFQRYALQKPPLDVKFARVQNGFPAMISFKVVVADHFEGPLVISTEADDWPVLGLDNGPKSFFVGTSEGVANYVALAGNGDFYDGSLVERARSFVQMEIDKQTPEIGGPIDILRLTTAGSSWIQRKDDC